MPSLADLDPADRAVAALRWEVLRPHVEGGVALTAAAAHGGVPFRTAQRWLARYREGGLTGLAPRARSDSGKRHLPEDLVHLIEGLALQRPAPAVTTITRAVGDVATRNGWPVPAYSTVRAIVTALDPHLVTLTHDGPVALRDKYELVYRRRAERPNSQWQADHAELDFLVIDEKGQPARPWLTVVLDDHSRAAAGYTLFVGAPSALHLSLALRQAIWTKTDPAWAVYGLPDVLYTDHGSDFTSHHLSQVVADLHIQLIHSAVARPQGRGKIERFFQSLTTELLAGLPGYLPRGGPPPTPRLTVSELDNASTSGSSARTTNAHIPRPASPRKHRGSATGGYRAPPTASKTSTCSS